MRPSNHRPLRFERTWLGYPSIVAIVKHQSTCFRDFVKVQPTPLFQLSQTLSDTVSKALSIRQYLLSRCAAHESPNIHLESESSGKDNTKEHVVSSYEEAVVES